LRGRQGFAPQQLAHGIGVRPGLGRRGRPLARSVAIASGTTRRDTAVHPMGAGSGHTSASERSGPSSTTSRR
ncbi:hypothetical protein, partial [Bordetella pertussis]|uniref:hypothetical protein n=1 Tax=Bordetella pertussis TaxID=520 RepID=UPI0018A71EE2